MNCKILCHCHKFCAALLYTGYRTDLCDSGRAGLLCESPGAPFKRSAVDPMLSALKKLAASEITLTRGKKQPAAAPEYIFLLDLERKKEYLLDLRTILRTPGSRRALPQLHMLETTVTRNEQRIRIPHEMMQDLVLSLIHI